MAYFLGRDVTLAISTEQEAFGLKIASNVLDITGTDGTAAADTDPIPPRVYGLKAVGTASVAEVSRLTIVNADETVYESQSAGSGKFVTLYDADGDSYVIYFICVGGGADVAPTEAGTATASLAVTLSTSTGSTSDIATAIAAKINADATFSQAFTASASSANVDITNAQKGDATDFARGSGFDDTHLTVNASGQTEGVDRSNNLGDITGLDVTIAAVDEDLNLLGQNTTLKVPIKQDISIAITRKKSDALFQLINNQARCGIRHTSGTIDADIGETDANLTFDNNTTKPTANTAGTNFGYRLFLSLGNNEVMTVMNACITDYSTTLNTDGITEESITFYSNVTPKVTNSSYTTISAEADF